MYVVCNKFEHYANVSDVQLSTDVIVIITLFYTVVVNVIVTLSCKDDVNVNVTLSCAVHTMSTLL